MNYSADIETAARIAAASPRGATYGDILAEVRKKQPGIALVTVRRWATSSAPGCGMVLAEVRTTDSAELERRRLFLTEQQAYSSGITIAYFVGQTHVGRRDELLQAIKAASFIDAEKAAEVMDCSIEYAQRHLGLMTSQGYINCNGRLGKDRRWYIGKVPDGDFLPSLKETLLKLASRPEGVGFDVKPWGRSTVAKALSEFFVNGTMFRRRTGHESRYFTRLDHADLWKSANSIKRVVSRKSGFVKRESTRCNSIANTIVKQRERAAKPVSRAPAQTITPENVKRTVCPPAPQGRFHVDPSEVSGVFSALGPGQYLKGRDDSPFTSYLKGL